jgi:tetratricopeptide (TPR) repeat protein
MRFISFILILVISTQIHAQKNEKIINVESVSTKELDKNVAKIFNQTKKLILQSRKSKDKETEILATQKWCLLLHNYQFFTQAQECYRFVGMNDKRTAKWPYLFAKVSLEMGDFTSASEGLVETTRRDNNYLPAHYYQIKMAIEENNLVLAFQLFDAVPNALRLTSSLLNLKGDVYFAIENYYIAIGFYQQSLRLVPKAKSLNYKIGKAYQNLDLMQLAEKYIKLSDEVKVKLIDPYYQEVKDTIVGEIPFIIKAKTALVNNDNELAIKLYQKALQYNPDNETALVNMAVAYFQDKKYDAAKQFLEKVLTINPKQQKALYNLGVLHYLEGDLDRSLEMFTDLFEINNSDITVNNYLAQIYYQQENYSKVIEIALYKIMGSHLDTQYLKAKSLIQLQQYAEAIQWLKKINENVPDNFNILMSLAKLYSQVPEKSLRNPQLALEVAQQAFKLKVNSQSYWQLIIALDENKKCQQLKDQMIGFSKTLKIDSKNVYVKLVQQRGQDLNCTYLND